MPGYISSSSSEDEAENAATKPPLKPKETERKPTRYECPADFVPLHHKPCSNSMTESLKNNKNELWLIKAPASFNPESFSGIKVPLSGLQTLKVPTTTDGAMTGTSQQIYNIMASTHGTSELHLLTSNNHLSDAVVFGPAFSGLLNVCESYGDSSANQTPQVIPAAPAPSIPPGLKQRFHPFGSKTPTLTCVAESEVDGAAFGPSSTTLHPLVVKRLLGDTGHAEEEEGGKKKKKKKEKRVKTEQEEEAAMEVVKVKEEPLSEIKDKMIMEPGVFQEEKEKKKKKKKKKDREREETEERVEPSVMVKAEEVSVKCEPIDSSYGDVVEGSGKMRKKKKKKKNKTEDN